MQSRRKASLLLIFLFSAGMLGMVVASVYWMVINQGVQQAFLDAEAEKEMADEAVEALVVPAVAKQGQLWLTASSAGSNCWSFNASTYEDRLKSLLVQALSPNPSSSSSQSIWDNLTVSVSDFPTSASLASKANTCGSVSDNLESPFCRFGATDQKMTVKVEGTLVATGQPYEWERSVAFWREVPSVEIPYLLYAPEEALGNLTFSAPLVARVGELSEVGTLDKAWDFDFKASAGVAPNTLCAYASSGSSLALTQQYALDTDAIVIGFSSGTLSVLSPSSVSLPSAFSTATFDGQTRCVINMASLPTTGDYINKKWYVHCVTNSDKLSGIVIKENTASRAASGHSIVSDGHIYFWMQGGSTSHAAEVFGTNYGAVAIASGDYSGSGATVATSDTIDLTGFLSLIDAPTSATDAHLYRFRDEFMGSGSLSGRTAGTYTNSVSPDGYAWTVHSASTATTADGSAGTGSLTISGGAADFSLPMEGTIQSFGGQRLEMGLEAFPVGSSAEIILANAQPYNTDNYISAKITRTSTSNFAYTLKSVLAGTTTDSESGTHTYSAGGLPPVFAVDYFPATKAISAHFTADPASSDLIVSKKLSSAISGVPAYVETVIIPNGTVKLDYWAIGAPRGTTIVSPHSGNLTIDLNGSIASGMGLAYAGSGTLTLNIQPDSAVKSTIRNSCERLLVTYPYCW